MSHKYQLLTHVHVYTIAAVASFSITTKKRKQHSRITLYTPTCIYLTCILDVAQD